MSDPKSERPAVEAGVEEHTHHWLIGNQDGPSSTGVCKECGESREFSNSLARQKPPWVNRSGAARRRAAEDSADGEAT
jgi:hypothetical protein